METPIGDPPIPTVVKKDFTLQLQPVSDVHGPISHYEIIVFTDWRSNTSDCLQVTHTPYNSTTTPYTAALLSAHNLTESITLGDNQHYGGFLNAPLIPNCNYSVFVRVTSKWKKDQDKSSCVSLGLFTDSTAPLDSGVLSIMSFDLRPILGIAIPIFTMKLLVLVVLMKIHFTQMARNTSETELNRKKQSTGNNILYRKRGDEDVTVEDAADQTIYEELKDAAPPDVSPPAAFFPIQMGKSNVGTPQQRVQGDSYSSGVCSAAL
ncbi:receptor-type tyrosine-protein phosphatase kappa-like [Eleutherodactylus coqui]|uniref:receptor-type tyrosine-protein phosphatase kappa-like n=1 Tax=Eleutherodactylus coqui TaxID=57060 RepID=UPI00346323FB